MIKADIYSGRLNRLRTEILIVTCFENVRPLQGWASEVDWYYNSVFSRLLKQNTFKGGLGQTLLVSSAGKLDIPKIILFGLGKSTCYGQPQFEAASARVLEILSGLKARESAIEMDELISFSSSLEEHTDALTQFSQAESKKGQAGSVLTLVLRNASKAKELQYSLQNEILLKGVAS